MVVKAIVLLGGLALIGFILWWFFGKHQVSSGHSVVSDQQQTGSIIVDGGYNPAVLTLKQGIPAKIVFHRKDPSSCLEKVVLPDFGIIQELPQNKDVTIPIDTQKAGVYNYACGMDMFHGKIIIK
ncbi:cupredoxin domain-containing protein [Liquorilactobacillus vini]|nr:cupredoxin domain-containing protein [Liquorilactobacillus vini]